MFTIKSTLLLLSSIVLMVIAWNTDITMVYIFFVVTLVMFILSFIHLYFNVPNITIERELNDIAYEDDILNVKLKINNKKAVTSFFVELIDYFPGGPPEQKENSLFILEMKGKESKIINYITTCYRRGAWQIGPAYIIVQDALGFFKRRKSLNIFSGVLVYPRDFRIFAFPPLASGSVSWIGVETSKISGDSHEFFGIREYQEGDAMSRIHWPLTAKHNELIVKQFERNAVQEVTIVLDLKKGHDIGVEKETTLEYAVKIAASISRYLLEQGALVQMVGYGKDSQNIPFGKGSSHLYAILEELAKVKADGDLTLGEALEESIFLTPYRSTLITTLLDNDIDSLSSLVQFKIKSVKLILIVLSTSTFGKAEGVEYLDEQKVNEFEEELASMGAYLYRISKGDDLKKKFEIV